MWLGAAVIGLAAASLVALTAANTVPSSQVDDQETPRGADDLKPSWCGTTVDNVVDGIAGGLGNDLILGTSLGEAITGGTGNDCIDGGGGNDTIDGGLLGDDWCKGGPGTDTFLNCEHTIQD